MRSGESIEDIISKRGIARAEVDALNPEVNLDKLQGGAVPAPRLNCAPCRLGTPICIAGSGMVSRVALLQHEEAKVARQVWDGDNRSAVGPELVLLACWPKQQAAGIVVMGACCQLQGCGNPGKEEGGVGGPSGA